MAVYGILPVRCIPFAIQHYDTHGSFSVDYINQAVMFFNKNLKLLMDQMNVKLPDAKLVYLHSFELPISPRKFKLLYYILTWRFQYNFWQTFMPFDVDPNYIIETCGKHVEKVNYRKIVWSLFVPNDSHARTLSNFFMSW